MSASYRCHTVGRMRHPRFLPHGRRNPLPSKRSEGRTRITCTCGRHLGDVLHSYALLSGYLVVLQHKPNTVEQIDENGTLTYRFGCKNHPGGTLIQQWTAREVGDLFEIAFATRNPIRLTPR